VAGIDENVAGGAGDRLGVPEPKVAKRPATGGAGFEADFLVMEIS
jgi:hypothetical protein